MHIADEDEHLLAACHGDIEPPQLIQETDASFLRTEQRTARETIDDDITLLPLEAVEGRYCFPSFLLVKHTFELLTDLLHLRLVGRDDAEFCGVKFSPDTLALY